MRIFLHDRAATSRRDRTGDQGWAAVVAALIGGVTGVAGTTIVVLAEGRRQLREYFLGERRSAYARFMARADQPRAVARARGGEPALVAMVNGYGDEVADTYNNRLSAEVAELEVIAPEGVCAAARDVLLAARFGHGDLAGLSTAEIRPATASVSLAEAPVTLLLRTVPAGGRVQVAARSGRGRNQQRHAEGA